MPFAQLLPVLEAPPQAFVLTSQDHVIVRDFDSARLADPITLLADSSKNRFLELAQLDIDLDPVLDVARGRVGHRRGFAGQQNVVFMGCRISVHELETP